MSRSNYWKLTAWSLLVLYPATYGLWPLFDTGHNPWALIDIAFRFAAWWWIWNRWEIVPRHHPRKKGTVTVTIVADTRPLEKAFKKAARDMERRRRRLEGDQ